MDRLSPSNDGLIRSLERLGITVEHPGRAIEELEDLAAHYVALVTARQELKAAAEGSSLAPPRRMGSLGRRNGPAV